MPLPPKPKGAPDDLAEVERALSVLQGRHPEHERVRREQEEVRATRQATVDAVAKAEAAQGRVRRLKVIAIGIGVVVVAGFAVVIFRREVIHRGRMEQVSDPYRAMGFVVSDTTSRGTPGVLESSLDPGCNVVASSDAAPVKITRPGATIEGPAPVLFCNCQGEKITVTSSVAEGGGLAVLHIDAATIGGSRAFGFAPFKPATSARTDETCADESFDKWVDAKRYPAAVADEKWLTADPRRAVLASAGARVLATTKADQLLALVEVPKESCLLVTSDGKGDRPSLRGKAGAVLVPAADGALAWCTAADPTVTLQHEGRGVVTTVALPATKIGGLRGFLDLLRQAGVSPASATVAPNDFAWDAKQMLVADAVPEGLITLAGTPEVAADPEARLVALSVAAPLALTPESAADTFSYCEPPLETSVRSICLFSGRQGWRAGGADASGGLARAKLPFWLFGLEGVHDPLALKAGLRLADLARRLRNDNFEATTIEAMTDQPNGIDVLGRTGEDAIVAVGVSPLEPWVFVYTDGPEWSIGGAPRVVPIKVLETVKLMALVRRVPPRDKRHSIVFRRHAR